MQYFTDAVLRGPTIGSMLMCFSAGLVGGITFLRKQSLLGEALSHASYPGVILGVVISGFLGLDPYGNLTTFFLLACAFISAILGFYAIYLLESKFKVQVDAALCFILSTFFGVGLTLASRVQVTHATMYNKIQSYLYGQAATMTDMHIWLYGLFSVVIFFSVFFFYKEIQMMTFDRDYAKSLGVKVRPIDGFIYFLTVLAVIIGIRSVGIVLMSAMLIAPPVAARQFTNRLSILFLLSGFIGLLSGFLGNYLSVELTNYFAVKYPETKLSFPTGPMIVIVAGSISLLSLFFAPQRGLFFRFFRMFRFRYQCLLENLLKGMWRKGADKVFTFKQLQKDQQVPKIYLWIAVYQLIFQGWLKKEKQGVMLTKSGVYRAAHIIRLHRLWEVYLAEYLGVGVERVHASAEEMEHILTPELEKELIVLLNDPKMDPHHQTIPKV